MSSAVASVVSMEVEGVVFSPTVTPRTSSKELILAGAGVRGLMIGGKFVKFTAIGVYIEEAIVPHLLLYVVKYVVKWKDKTAEELSNTLDFYIDLVTCPYEKVARVAFVSPLTGVEFCRKVSENCRIACEATGIYSEAEANAIEQLKDVFKNKNFLPGYSILYTISPAGLVIAFSTDSWSVPEKATAVVIENRILAEGFLSTIIGQNGVYPSVKASIADRVTNLKLVLVRRHHATFKLDLVVQIFDIIFTCSFIFFMLNLLVRLMYMQSSVPFRNGISAC